MMWSADLMGSNRVGHQSCMACEGIAQIGAFHIQIAYDLPIGGQGKAMSSPYPIISYNIEIGWLHWWLYKYVLVVSQIVSGLLIE